MAPSESPFEIPVANGVPGSRVNRTGPHRIYESADKKLVIEKSASGGIEILHNLKTVECKKYRIRAVTKLHEWMEDQRAIVSEYAPGARSRLDAESTIVTIKSVMQKIDSLWPEDQWGQTPIADEVD